MEAKRFVEETGFAFGEAGRGHVRLSFGGDPADIVLGTFRGRALLDDLQVQGLEGASESGQQLVASGGAGSKVEHRHSIT